jgi:hypothetical protein
MLELSGSAVPFNRTPARSDKEVSVMATLSDVKGDAVEQGTPEKIAIEEPGRATRSPLYLGLSLVLAVLVGFGLGWLVFRDTGVDVPSDVDQLIDDYQAAWEANDGELAVSYMTLGAAHVSAYTGLEGFSGDELVSFIDSSGEIEFTNGEYVGVFGDLPYIVVKAQTVEGDSGHSVFHIVDRGGELKIANQTWYVVP